jgi:hypothetical protein
VRGGVEVVVDRAGAERVAPRAGRAAVQLRAQVGEQWRAIGGVGGDQVGVRERARVVDVERGVAGLAREVLVRPVLRLLQPGGGTGIAERLAGAGELRRAELEVIAPR